MPSDGVLALGLWPTSACFARRYPCPMVDLTATTWAVLKAAHELQHGDRDASIDTSEIGAAALAAVNGTDAARDFQARGGTYARIQPQIWALDNADTSRSTLGWRRQQHQTAPRTLLRMTTAFALPTWAVPLWPNTPSPKRAR